MKKLTACLMAVLMMAASLTACGGAGVSAGESGVSSANSTKDEKIQIVATIFPQYDWVRQILGEQAENAELTLLLDSGVDLHSYQPTTDDIVKISSCDLFLYTGGESDAWVEDALATATNDDMVAVNLMEVLGDSVKEEELVEGMEHDHEHEEVDPDSVLDRPLSDFAGDWVTIENALETGDLDEYVTHEAEESGTDFDAQKAAFAERWASEYEVLDITESTITFGGASSDYEYIGYEITDGEHGDSVWYGFAAKTPAEGVPAYVAFSDHSTGPDEHPHEEGDGHDESGEHEEAAHFHMRYGNEGFDALVAMEDWAPTYFPADASGEEIAGAMGGHSHEEETELDEHVWLSLRNAQTLCGYIADRLGEVDPEHADVYAANAAAYNAQLAALDADYKAAVDSAPVKTLLFADRFPFRYLVDDYGLDYYAAFSGCSAETEASFEVIVFLAEKVKELGLKNIMVIETSDQSIAKTVIQNTDGKDQQILVLNSLQSVTASDIASGASYLALMEDNLDVLKQALA